MKKVTVDGAPEQRGHKLPVRTAFIQNSREGRLTSSDRWIFPREAWGTGLNTWAEAMVFWGAGAPAEAEAMVSRGARAPAEAEAMVSWGMGVSPGLR